MDKTYVKFLFGVFVLFSMVFLTVAAPTNITANVNSTVTELNSESSIESIIDEVASNIKHVPYKETRHNIEEEEAELMPPSNAMMRDQELPVNSLPPNNYQEIPMVDGSPSLSTKSDSVQQSAFRDVFLKSMLDYLLKNNSNHDNVHLFANHLVKSVGQYSHFPDDSMTHDVVLDGGHPSGVSKRYTEDSRPYYRQNMQQDIPQALNNLNDLLEEEEEEENPVENTENKLKTELVKDLSSPVVVKPIIINVPQSHFPSQPRLQTIREDDFQFYPYGGNGGGSLRRFGRYVDQDPSYNMIQTLPQQHQQEVPNTWHVYGKHNYLILQGGNLHLPDNMALYEGDDLSKQKNNKRDNVPQMETSCKTCNCKVPSEDCKKDVGVRENSSHSTKFLDNLQSSFSETKKPESNLNQGLSESHQKISSTHSRQMPQPFESNNFNLRSFENDPLIDQNEFPVNDDYGQQFYDGIVSKPTKHESDRDKTLSQPFKFVAQY